MSYPKFFNVLNTTTSNTGSIVVNNVFSLQGVGIESPRSGDTVQVGSQGLIVAPVDTLGSLVVKMPDSAIDGQVLYLSFSQDIKKVSFVSTLNMANKSSVTFVHAGDTLSLIFNEKLNKWFKLSGSNCTCAATATPAVAVAPTPLE